MNGSEKYRVYDPGEEGGREFVACQCKKKRNSV